MKKADLRAVKIGGCGMTTKILFISPKKINGGWVWYGRYNGYVRAATNQMDAMAIRDEAFAACDDK